MSKLSHVTRPYDMERYSGPMPTYASWHVTDPDLTLVTGEPPSAGSMCASLPSSTAVQHSKDLLLRLDRCIKSTDFKERVWRKLMGNKEEETVSDEFVHVSHEDVVEALAEHIVISYVTTYHQSDLQQCRRQSTFQPLTTAMTAVSSVIASIATVESVRALWEWGVYLAPYGKHAITLSSIYSSSALSFLMLLLYRSMSFFLCCLS